MDRVLSALDTLLDETPHLESAVDFYEELLPILYGATPKLDGLSLHFESAQAKLREGVPLLWGEFIGPHAPTDVPGVDPNIDLLMTLCRLAADGGVEDGERLIKAYTAGQVDLHKLIHNALTQDRPALNQSATKLDVDLTLLTSIGNMLLTPICRAYETAFRSALDFGEWTQGYCPVCGDWPILSELLGRDKVRNLRCGRCTAAWKFSRLTCFWCDNTERDELGFLFDPEVETWRIDTCDHCHGYAKTKITFEPLEGDMLLVHDLKSMSLDHIAGSEGYKRPIQQPLAQTGPITHQTAF